jgi:putative endonuclease
MKPGYTYIMGSHTGTLYIGVTSDIYRRTRQHQGGRFEGFSKKYGCTRLLYYEEFADISNAIARETQFKGWRREKKLNLIRTKNPEFRDRAEKWDWKTHHHARAHVSRGRGRKGFDYRARRRPSGSFDSAICKKRKPLRSE